VTIARALTQTVAGIRPADVCGFVIAQLLGMLLAILVVAWLFEDARPTRGSATTEPRA
jgi:glycerol uptake facilitator-like aquaporin